MTTADTVVAPPSAETEILRLSAEKFRWKTERRIDRVEDLFDDSLVFVHLSGHVSSKDEWIAELRSGRFIYDAIEVDEAEAKAYGDVAVLVGRAAFTVTMGGFRSTYHLIYTEVYARRGGRWTLVNLRTCSC